MYHGAGVAHRLDDWGLILSRSNDGIFSPHHCIQTSSGTHPASYQMDTGGKSGWGMKLTTHVNLVLRL